MSFIIPMVYLQINLGFTTDSSYYIILIFLPLFLNILKIIVLKL